MTEEFLPFERVRCAIKHEKFDRIPRDIGGVVSNISAIAYKALLNYWNIQTESVLISDRVQQLATVDEHVLKKFKIDTRHIRANPPSKSPLNSNSNSFRDLFGIKYQRIGTKQYPTLYYEMVEYPLASANLSEIYNYSWPKPQKTWFEGKANLAKKYFADGFAVVANPLSGGICEQTIWLRGFDQFLRDLYNDREIILELLDQNLANQLEIWHAWLEEVGEWVTIAIYGDDYGTQERLLLHTRMWREMMKPRVNELLQDLKKAYPHVHFQLHSCGAIEPIISDLIEIGFDILNPVQPRAKGMEHGYLKENYGQKICFHGGFDIQETMPKGTLMEIQREVNRLHNTLAKDKTGYIFAFAHNLLADTPPENIINVFQKLDQISGTD